MSNPPKYMAIELKDRDIQEDLPKIVKDMSQIRAETIKDRELSSKQKDEYLHLTYRLASGLKAIADEQMTRKMQIIANKLTKNSSLLKYDSMQDAYWKEQETKFADTLDSLLITTVGDDFHNVDSKHHILQAIKYLGVEEMDFEKREEVYNNILPFQNAVQLKSQGFLKNLWGSLFGARYKATSLENLTLNIDATRGGFTPELIKIAKERGYTSMLLDVTEKECERITGTPEGDLTKKVFEEGEGIIINKSKGDVQEGTEGVITHCGEPNYRVEVGGSPNYQNFWINKEYIDHKTPRPNPVFSIAGKNSQLIGSKERQPNKALVNLANEVVKYTKPLSYLVLGALPESLQKRLEKTLPTFKEKDAFTTSYWLEAIGG